MLCSLLRCGLEGWHVHIGIEPGPTQGALADLCSDILPDNQCTLTRNPTRLGVRANPYATIARAFESGSTFNLCLEDDFLLAPDALLLADWYKENHRPRWAALNLLAGTCGSAANLSVPDCPSQIFESRCFNSIGVGFTRADWNRISTIFRGRKRPFYSRRSILDWGWDWAVYGAVLMSPQLRVIQPLAARCTHTGETGTHCTPEFQEKSFSWLPMATRECEHATREGFTLQDIKKLPPAVAAHVYAQHDAAKLRRMLLIAKGDRRATPPKDKTMPPDKTV